MKIYCIGIGGIGVSALANYYLQAGHQVSGSDVSRSETIDRLEGLGARVLIGEQKAENVPDDADLVVYSAAIGADHPELQRARELSHSGEAEVLTYSQALGRLTREHKTIAITGTHGKSTTTSMTALALIEAGFDPTVVVGTLLREFNNTNFRSGTSDYLVIEADEFNSAFLDYEPDVAVVLNMEEDHMEHFESQQGLERSFAAFFLQIQPGGTLIYNGQDAGLVRLVEKMSSQMKEQSIEAVDYTADKNNFEKIRRLLKVPGEHNVSNAAAVLSAGRALGAPEKAVFHSLSQFRGSWRRLQEVKVRSQRGEFTCISDYAHHPTEIAATLRAVREKYKGKEVVVVVQPHDYARWLYLFDQFQEVLVDKHLREKLLLTDVYFVAGRNTESQIKQAELNKKLPRHLAGGADIEYIPFDKQQLTARVRELAANDRVLVLMGAGDIHDVFLELTGE